MKNSKDLDIIKSGRFFKKYYLIIILLWTVLILTASIYDSHQFYQFKLASAKEVAITNVEKDYIYRRWLSKQGGMYLPISEEIQVNPYLKNVKEKNIKTPEGKELTLVNPAYMTRLVQEFNDKKYGIKGHITSMNPIRPENKPDDWEKKGLTTFQMSNGQSTYEIKDIDGKPYFRYMIPMYVEKGCLKCHGYQDYKIGDLRGGISVSVPWEPYKSTISALNKSHHTFNFMIWLLGSGGLLMWAKRQKQYFETLESYSEEIEAQNLKLAAQNEEFELLNEELTATNNEIYKREADLAKSLHEKNTLLRELYHRTKNTMQVIRGMLVLQADKFPASDDINKLVEITDQRVQAISLVHQMLYKTSDLSRISIKDYLHELTDLTINSYDSNKGRIKSSIDIEETSLIIDTAIPFGLIVNELITNSIKYAFPDNRKGTIKMQLHVDSSGNICFIYHDNGIGVPDDFDFRNQDSLGLDLIHSIGENQMSGTIEMKNLDGIYFSITFPANLYEERV